MFQNEHFIQFRVSFIEISVRSLLNRLDLRSSVLTSETKIHTNQFKNKRRRRRRRRIKERKRKREREIRGSKCWEWPAVINRSCDVTHSHTHTLKHTERERKRERRNQGRLFGFSRFSFLFFFSVSSIYLPFSHSLISSSLSVSLFFYVCECVYLSLSLSLLFMYTQIFSPRFSLFHSFFGFLGCVRFAGCLWRPATLLLRQRRFTPSSLPSTYSSSSSSLFFVRVCVRLHSFSASFFRWPK